MEKLQSFDDLFTKRIFRIPDYQRGYAWQKRQLTDFWEDLLSLDGNRSHYTGVISIKSVPKEKINGWHEEKWLINKRNYKPYYVVDGQQRLTTASILLNCLVEKAKVVSTKNGLRKEEAYLNGYTLKEIENQFISISEPPDNILKAYKFGYETDNPSFEYLRYKIFKEKQEGEVNETFYTLNLENAKLFFDENIDKIIQGKGPSILETLFEKLTQRFLFNLYELNDDFDVFVAFETMNNRGKSLSDLELLKNRLIYLTTLYSNKEADYDKKYVIREIINDSWKQVYFQLGRNKLQPLNDDDFLKAHWIMYFRFTRKKGNDYIKNLLDEEFSPKNVLETIKTSVSSLKEVATINEADNNQEEDFEIDIEENEEFVQLSKLPIQNIVSYVKSLQNAAKHWYNSYNPEKIPELVNEEKKYLDKLNRIGIMFFRPLIMASFANENIQIEDRIKLFKAIERFIFINFRMSRAMSNHRSSHYYNAARELYKDKVSIDKLIEQLEWDMDYAFNENGSYKINYFTDYIEKRFSSNQTGFYGWNSIRYFLYEYEEELRELRNQPILTWKNFIKNRKDKISIEHILPQTTDKDCWKKVIEKYSDSETKFLKGSLGNLLPLSMAINSSLQNDCFEGKKKVKQDDNGTNIRNGYENGSYSEQMVSQEIEWTAETIMNRGLKLLEFMERRWSLNLGDNQSKLELLHLSFLDEENQELT